MSRNLIIEVIDGLAIEGFIANVNVGASVAAQLRTVGNTGSVVWSLESGAFPDDFAIGASSGLVSGTAATAGTYSVTIRATETTGRFTRRTFTWRIQAVPLGIVGTPAGLQLGRTDTWPLTIIGGVPPYTISASTLPAGFTRSLLGDTVTVVGTLTSAHGVAAGTTGAFAASVAILDSEGTPAAWAASVVIEVPALIASFFSLPDADIDAPYLGSVEAEGGTGGYVYSLDTAPGWMSIDSGTGALSGTPTETATGVTVTARATDSEGNFDTVTDTLDVVTNVDAIAVSIYGKLTSWWEMDEASGTRVDRKGTNDLAVFGTENGTRAGVRGAGDSAANFGTTTMCLTAPDDSSLRTPDPLAARCSFGWIRTTNTAVQPIIYKWQADNAGTLDRTVYIDSGSLWGVGSNGSVYVYPASTASVSVDTWQFFVSWIDSADQKERLQVDDGTIYTSSSAAAYVLNAGPLKIGSSDGVNPGFFGAMQRFGWIRDAFLTAEERAWLYNSGSGRTIYEIKTLAGIPPDPALESVIADLAPEWYVKLDEPAPHYIGQPCIDYSGNALTATYNAAAGSDAAPLFAGSSAALKFNTSTQITGPTITRSDVNEAFSVSYFIKGPATTATRKIISTNLVTTQGFAIETTNPNNRGALLLGLTSGSTRFTDTSGNIWDDAPHHIVITVAQVGGFLEIRMYTDGVQTFFNGASTGSVTGLSWPLRLGTGNFESTLDEVSFWQRALSAAEVLSIYDARHDGAPAPTPGFTGILDAYPTDLYYACSTRHLISTYSGPIIRVQRTSDSAQLDIYGDGAGGLDITTMTDFVGANDAYCMVYFDQTGNGRHITASNTVGNRGKIIIAGAVQYNGGHPAASYPTYVRDVAPTNALLAFTNIVTVSGVSTQGSVGVTNSTSAYHGFWLTGSGTASFGGSGISASSTRVDGVAPAGSAAGNLATLIAASGSAPMVISSSRTNSSGTWRNEPIAHISVPTIGTVTDRIGYATDSVASLGTIEAALKVGM